jgi:hypothetical protein
MPSNKKLYHIISPNVHLIPFNMILVDHTYHRFRWKHMTLAKWDKLCNKLREYLIDE